MTEVTHDTAENGATPNTEPPAKPVAAVAAPPREIGGRKGPDPVRYGDWEKNGRCIDF